jgi:hypothetical protein
MEIKKPIMVVCAGRSGSTMLYRILARHQDLGWLSTYNQILPSQTWLSIFSNLYELRLFDRIKHASYFPKPFSPYRFWDRYLPGIARHDRPLTADDIPEESIEPLRRTIARVLRYQRKKRFLMKVTGWARMAYFNRVFPDALFIHLQRKPIAVVASWLNAGWLNVTTDIDSESWEWGRVPDAYRRIHADLGGGPVLAAAIKTQLDVDDLRRNVAQFPDRTLEFAYEDFIVNPREYLRKTLDFCGLSWDGDFESVVNRTAIRNYADRWKKQLAAEDAERIQTFFDRVEGLEVGAGQEHLQPQGASLDESARPDHRGHG